MFGMPLDVVLLLLVIGMIAAIVYLLHKKSSEMSVLSLIILHIILFFAVEIPILIRVSVKEPPTFYFILLTAALVGIPVHLVVTIIGRRKKRKGATCITLEDDCVTGIGEIVNDGSGFGGVSFGTGGIRPMIGGTPTKSKLRGFRVPYDKIIGVDLLVQEPGIVLMTPVANYVCYINDAQAVQEAIVKRIS